MTARFIHAIWLGSGIFLVLATQAAFKAAASPTAAAAFVGALLGRWHYIALAAPIALLFLEWKRARTAVLLIIFAGVLFAAVQVLVDLRIRSIRAKSPVPISELSRQDPVRRQFGMLHGVSTILLLAQIVAAGAALAVDREAYEARKTFDLRPSTLAEPEDPNPS
ncbi:MAG TPA: hypothetical protein VFT12_07555 [Thermoanaerobaculia bacterium]|nr:hypothetical protein [Thermoanaerobaculia bacterium]